MEGGEAPAEEDPVSVPAAECSDQGTAGVGPPEGSEPVAEAEAEKPDEGSAICIQRAYRARSEKRHGAASKIQKKYRKRAEQKSKESKDEGPEDPAAEQALEPESPEDRAAKEEEAALSIQRGYRKHKKAGPQAPALEEDLIDEELDTALESIRSPPPLGHQTLQPLIRLPQVPGTGMTRPRLALSPKFVDNPHEAGQYSPSSVRKASPSVPRKLARLQFPSPAKAPVQPPPAEGESAEPVKQTPVTHWMLQRTAEPRPEYRNKSRKTNAWRAHASARRHDPSIDDPAGMTFSGGFTMEDVDSEVEDWVPWHASLPQISTDRSTRPPVRLLYDSRCQTTGNTGSAWGMQRAKNPTKPSLLPALDSGAKSVKSAKSDAPYGKIAKRGI